MGLIKETSHAESICIKPDSIQWQEEAEAGAEGGGGGRRREEGERRSRSLPVHCSATSLPQSSWRYPGSRREQREQ